MLFSDFDEPKIIERGSSDVPRDVGVFIAWTTTFTDKRPCHSDADHLVNKGLGYNGVAIPGMANISGDTGSYNSVQVGSRVSLIDLLGVSLN